MTTQHSTPENEPLLELNQVSLVYRALPVLCDIDLRILKGQHWACIGPNGAGKTSLANILCGRATHYSGTYFRCEALERNGVAYVCFEQAKALCDRDRKLDDSEFRADATDPGTTVRQAILTDRGHDTDLMVWAKRLGITHILDRGLRYISTGEMRKTLLVSAILSAPSLLILDSPVDGLDLEAQAAMRDIIEELLTAHDMTLLILCRQIQDVPAGVSHILALDTGRIAQCGERDLLDSSEIQQLMNPELPGLTELPPPAARPYALPEQGPLLELRNVSVRYGDLQVLREVHWRFDRGMHCCVSGPNGCGKTTLLSLITGDNHKAYGQDITLFGIPRGSGESIWEIKEKFGQIDTQLHLNFARGMKVIEVVVSGFFDTIGLYDNWGDEQRQRAQHWLSALGIGELAIESFDALSFGLQRVTLLARAMVKSPIVLLLDEPTLGLDGFHRRLILRAIDHIAQHTDTQVIFVSHSAGDMPACINQQLRFLPADNGFDVICQ